MIYLAILQHSTYLRISSHQINQLADGAELHDARPQQTPQSPCPDAQFLQVAKSKYLGYSPPYFDIARSCGSGWARKSLAAAIRRQEAERLVPVL